MTDCTNPAHHHDASPMAVTEVQGGPLDGLAIGIVNMADVAVSVVIGFDGTMRLDSNLSPDDTLDAVAMTVVSYALDHKKGLPDLTALLAFFDTEDAS